MKLTLWIPPPALALKALGPEPGGGRPSVAYRHEHLDERKGMSYYVEAWTLPDDSVDIVGNAEIYAKHEAVGLILRIDGKECAFSLERVRELLPVGALEHAPEWMSDAQWEVQILVRELGGEIVDWERV